MLFCATDDPRGPTDHVSDLALRSPTPIWMYDTLRWTCLCGHAPIMRTTTLAILAKIQGKKIVRLILYAMELAPGGSCHRVFDHRFCDRNTDPNVPNRSRNFDEVWSTQAGLDTVIAETVIAKECRKWGVFTCWSTMDQPSLAGIDTRHSGISTINLYPVDQQEDSVMSGWND